MLHTMSLSVCLIHVLVYWSPNTTIFCFPVCCSSELSIRNREDVKKCLSTGKPRLKVVHLSRCSKNNSDLSKNLWVCAWFKRMLLLSEALLMWYTCCHLCYAVRYSDNWWDAEARTPASSLKDVSQSVSPPSRPQQRPQTMQINSKLCLCSSYKPSAAAWSSGSGTGDEASGGTQPRDDLLTGNQWNVANGGGRCELDRYRDTHTQHCKGCIFFFSNFCYWW